MKLQNYNEALTVLNRSLQIEQKASLYPEKDNNIAQMLCEVGRCHMNLQNYNEALTVLNRSLQIKQKATLSPNKHNNIALTLYKIG